MISLRSRIFVVAGMVAGFLFLPGAPASWAQAQKLQGVPNFGRVSDSIYRGAQPSKAGFAALHHIGVAMVVNFRDEAGETASEKRDVEAAGMKYIGIPWSGHDEPSNAQVVQFLDLVRTNPNAKIFVHCKAGADRTGVMVAAYRIAMEHKSVADAVSEMHAFHYHWLFLPHLERYVRELPNQLATETVFSAYVAPQPVAPAFSENPFRAAAAAAAAITGPVGTASLAH